MTKLQQVNNIVIKMLNKHTDVSSGDDPPHMIICPYPYTTNSLSLLVT
jgi:hypothetical protein